MIQLAIFASGSGTNAERIMQHFQSHDAIRVALVLSNNSDAYVLQRAAKFNVPSVVFNRTALNHGDVLQTLKEHKIDFLVLAGFMWLVPADLVRAYEGRIVNIHPALLPKYGGKGMYGDHVHEAVVAAGEKQTGITIHRVNERYDEGAILFQASVEVLPEDTPAEVARKVHELEYRYYPEWIEKAVVSGLPS
ncbi:MAG: phosphoribosylglycinamide formyltransferase [Flavobacteriales bacterium]|nr:phosphoribosylglycinamide formyltransferase [Flavobacteriales bacterium]MCB9449619.1 phosphoribosylglycinamide formyltransferase [Flavobacteriales bacterium]